MTKFLIERSFGHVTPEELAQNATRSLRTMRENFPQLTWEYSHVIETKDGIETKCIYLAPSEEVVREHSKQANLPLVRVSPVINTITPHDFEGSNTR
jgi:hypothetical protein